MMKLLSILVIFLFILGLKAQDAESTYSRKLVHNNAKDGFFHSIIGEIDGNVLVCFKNIKYWQKNQKYKIIKFDKNLSVVKKSELNGYPINNTDNKDIENSRKLTYVKSIILKDRIFIFWEKRIKYSTYLYVETLDKDLNVLKKKTLISSFDSDVLAKYLPIKSGYVVYSNDNEFILLHKIMANTNSQLNFKYIIFGSDFKKLKENIFSFEESINELYDFKSNDTKTNLSFRILSFSENELLFECEESILLLDLESNNVTPYTSDLGVGVKVYDSRAFIIRDKVFIVGLYMDDSEGEKELTMAKGVFYDELTSLTNSVKKYSFIDHNIDLSGNSKFIDIALKEIDYNNYLMLFKSTSSNILNLISFNTTSSINWVDEVKVKSDFNIIKGNQGLFIVEYDNIKAKTKKSLSYSHISSAGEISNGSVLLETHTKIKDKVFFNSYYHENHLYLTFERKVINPFGLVIKLVSIPVWPAIPFTFLNGDLKRRNGQLVKLNFTD